MEWLWTAQVTVNFLFFIWILFWWQDRKSQKLRNLERSLRECLQRVTMQSEDLDRRADEMRKKTDEHLAYVASIGNHARTLLQRGKEEMQSRIPSLEEQDLLDLASELPSSSNAPSGSKQTEPETHSSAESVPALGLKAVLREQLF